ncbi:MAG: TonB-dependent receptor, partial [Saprospiraceae bacterium]|nr:TonB-dependent receptor [Saprospiraceae bacterium]
DNTNENLSALLENETGVQILRNGSGIAKPVVHGMYGNRLTILNNGIAQSGQQWGNGHSPEIDPLSADKITVLKGVNAIEYGGGNLGGAILVEPNKISREPHLHGQVNYAYETNGRGHNLNARVEKFSPVLAWRINSTIKNYGDKKSADYFLNNTGLEELNFAVQLEKAWNNRLLLDFYASTFNTKLGVLRGSQVGNLSDLETALTRDVPFYTDEEFSYEIEAPKQEVSHHLLKLKAKYFIDDHQYMQLVLAGQKNVRREFDVRRSGRSDIPAMSLDQYTMNAEVKYFKEFGENWELQIGNQNIFIDNTNNPETGILPLIPDYLSWETGVYTTLTKQHERINFNLGMRYDFEYQDVVTITNTEPRKIARYENNFHNAGGVAGLKYDLSHTQSLSFQSGVAMRNPAINELYSNGLHQGVSGIEEGDTELNKEISFKSTLDYKWLPNARFSFNTLMYFQKFNDYIFLNPQEEIRLTIRGAFPVFSYEQTDAHIYGLDISTQYMIGNSLFGLLKYSYIRGEDTENDIPLVNIPSNSFYGSLTFRHNKSINLSSRTRLEQLEVELNNRYVFMQNNLLPDQDFVLPPGAYNLTGIRISSNLIMPGQNIRFFTKIENLFNVKYRDYLNRQRYFADDTGISITLGLKLKF